MLSKKYVPTILTILIICTMVGCSELLSEREIIFPEIAAIATGALLSPNFGWKTNKIRIFIFIMICAALGMGIVYFCPGPIWAQMILAYLLSQIILYIQNQFRPNGVRHRAAGSFTDKKYSLPYFRCSIYGTDSPSKNYLGGKAILLSPVLLMVAIAIMFRKDNPEEKT